MNIFAKQVKLSDESIYIKIFNRFYYSSLFAIMCGCVGQIFNNIIVGKVLGEGKLAIMSLTLPIYYIFATIGNLAGIGGSAICANFIGERKNDKCKGAFTTTYLLTFILCLVFSLLVVLFTPQIVTLLGTPKALIEEVAIYTRITSIGGLFTACVYLSFNFLRLDGRSFETTFVFIIMAGINIILDILLKSMGIKGIAIATVISSAVATLFGVVVLCFKSKTLTFCKIKIKDLYSFSLDIFKVGSPGATENASILLKSYTFNRIITLVIGAGALSSLTVVNSINSFSMAITVGCAGALVPIVGVFSAEKDCESIRKLIKSAIKITSLFLVIFMAITVWFAPQIAMLFGVTEGIDDTVLAIRIFTLSLPFAMITNILIYLHLANKHIAISNILTVLKQFVLVVGFAFLLMIPLNDLGLWLSFTVCEIGTILAAAVLHFISHKKDKYMSPILLLDTRYEKNGKSIAFNTNDDNDSLKNAVAKLEEFCDQNDLIGKRAMFVTLSIDEMLHMAADHSTRLANDNTISIRVILFEDIIVLRLRYVGELFNPIEYYETKKTDSNDVDAMLELADCLGVKMVVDACDVVDYRTTFGINNLTIVT